MKLSIKIQKGVTLMELLIVVGMIVLIAMSSLALYKYMSTRYLISKEIGRAGQLMNNVEVLLSTSPLISNGLTSIDNAAMKASNILPKEMQSAAGNFIRTSWAENGVVINSTGTDTVLMYNNVPATDCYDFSSFMIFAYDSVAINGVTPIANHQAASANCTAALNNVVITKTRIIQ